MPLASFTNKKEVRGCACYSVLNCACILVWYIAINKGFVMCFCYWFSVFEPNQVILWGFQRYIFVFLEVAASVAGTEVFKAAEIGCRLRRNRHPPWSSPFRNGGTPRCKFQNGGAMTAKINATQPGNDRWPPRSTHTTNDARGAIMAETASLFSLLVQYYLLSLLLNCESVTH